MKNFTIYRITNKLTGESYVGQTSLPLKNRVYLHRSAVRQSPESNASARMLIAKAVREAGWENFEVVEVQKCSSREEADAAERFWIKELGALSPNGYNTQRGGVGGAKHTDASRQKIGDYHRGRKRSEETRAKISASPSNRERSDFTWKDINLLRARWKSGESGKSLAGEFGMSEQNVSMIVRNRLWYDPGYSHKREIMI